MTTQPDPRFVVIAEQRHIDISDEPTPTRTYRERREAKAERLRDWANKRETRGTASVERAREMGAAIPFGQPVLVDHYSYGRDMNYRNRIGKTYDRGFSDLAKAGEMNARADGIEAQAAHAIYSDDHDAIERLTERIEALEAERDRIKRYNATCRKGAPDLSILDDTQRADLASVQRHTPYNSKNGAMPAYALSNLSGNITRNRKRLAQLTKDSAQ